MYTAWQHAIFGESEPYFGKTVLHKRWACTDRYEELASSYGIAKDMDADHERQVKDGVRGGGL